jgi:hypothetical protein
VCFKVRQTRSKRSKGIENKVRAKHRAANRLLEAGMLRCVCGGGYCLNDAYGGGNRTGSRGSKQ